MWAIVESERSAGPPQLCPGKAPHYEAASQPGKEHSRLPHLLLDTTTVMWCIYACSSVKWACSCDHSPVASGTATTGALSCPLSHSRLPPQPRPLISTILHFKMPGGWNQSVASCNGPFSLEMIPLWPSGLLCGQRLLFAANSFFRAWECRVDLTSHPADGHLHCLSLCS